MVSEPKTGITVRKPQFKEITMKLKLNKSKLKDLSSQAITIDATKKIAGGGLPDPHTKMVNCAGPHTKCTNCDAQVQLL